MREIKFRGKTVDTGNWVYGSYQADVMLIGKHTIIYSDYDGYYCEEEVIPETIGQYTGLKDKNGKEIYEGDIISTDLDRPFNIVVFRNGAFMFQCHDSGKDYYDYMFSVEEESDRWGHGEVIGNIYENPELLEGTV